MWEGLSGFMDLVGKRAFSMLSFFEVGLVYVVCRRVGEEVELVYVCYIWGLGRSKVLVIKGYVGRGIIFYI